MRKTPNTGLPRPLARAGLVLSMLLASTAAFGQAQVKDLDIFELDANAHDEAAFAGPDWENVAPNGTVAARQATPAA